MSKGKVIPPLGKAHTIFEPWMSSSIDVIRLMILFASWASAKDWPSAPGG